MFPMFTSFNMADVLRRCLTLVYILLMTSICFGTSRKTVKYQRLCKDSDIQIVGPSGVKIEPYERSRVELLLADPKRNKKSNKFELKFDFKTSSVNGTLFYGLSEHNPKEIIALLLRHGHLIYKIQCPSIHADVRLSTPNHEPVNDNQWHTVQFTTRFGRRGQKGHIKIDGHSHKKLYDLNCEHITTIVMGGHNPDQSHHQYKPDFKLNHWYEDGERMVQWAEERKWLADEHGHFEGCIRDLHVTSYLTTPPKYYAVSQCDL